MKTQLFLAVLTLLCFNSLFAQCKKHLSDSLIARWVFNGNANDLSGNGNDGKIHGAKMTTGRCNDSGSAYLFKSDHLNQYIQVHNSKSLNLAKTDYSICAWIRANYVNHPCEIVSKRTGTHLHDGYNCSVTSTHKFGFAIGGGSSDAFQMVSSAVVADSTWKFVVVTYKKKHGIFTMYINGVLDTIYKHIPSPTKTNSFLRIGNDTYNTTSVIYEFDGKIDDIRMYNRALDTCEVTALYNNSCNTLNLVQNNIVNQASSINSRINSINIYPNPAKNIIQISFPKSIISNNIYFLLYDFSGRKVLEQRCLGKSLCQQLNVADIASGTYSLTIVEDDKVINKATVVISK